MSEAEHFGAAILEVCRRNPDRIAVVAGGRSLSYLALRGHILNFALNMQARGIGRGSCVAIDTPDTSIGFVALWAASLLGCRCLQASPAALANAAIGVTHILRYRPGEAPVAAANVFAVDLSWLAPPPGAAAGAALSFPGYGSPADPFFIASSSGSTGTPKASAISFGLFYKRSLARSAELAAARRVSCLFSSLSPIGSSAMTAIALAGNTIAVQAAGQPLDRDVDVVIGAPAQYADLFRSRAAGSDFSRAEALVAGSSITPEFVHRLFDMFGRVRYRYGTTETGPVCGIALSRPTDYDGTVGSPLPGRTVEIVDEHGVAQPPETPGLVRVKTPHLVDGYLGDPEATARMFRDGWFYPGDIGALTAEGRLRLLGRANDQVNVYGTTFALADVDSRIAGVGEVEDAVCFVENDGDGLPRVAALVRPQPGAIAPALAERIVTACRAALPIAAVPWAVYVGDVVPRNQHGKPDRQAAAAAAARATRVI